MTLPNNYAMDEAALNLALDLTDLEAVLLDMARLGEIVVTGLDREGDLVFAVA